jgi:hypothetical protein
MMHQDGPRHATGNKPRETLAYMGTGRARIDDRRQGARIGLGPILEAGRGLELRGESKAAAGRLSSARGRADGNVVWR